MNRKERKRARLEKFGSLILSKETIDRMVDEPEIPVDYYCNLYLEPIRRPRLTVEDIDGKILPKEELEEVLNEFRTRRSQEEAYGKDEKELYLYT